MYDLKNLQEKYTVEKESCGWCSFAELEVTLRIGSVVRESRDGL